MEVQSFIIQLIKPRFMWIRHADKRGCGVPVVNK